jgi:hypothetical protein
VMSGFGLYDPTSIMNATELNRARKEGLAKLTFYILSFFYYIYGYRFYAQNLNKSGRFVSSQSTVSKLQY